MDKELQEDHDSFSRIDYEYFNRNRNALRVKGLSGCKTPTMCEEDSPIGHFRLDEDSLDAYFDGINSWEELLVCPRNQDCDR